LFSATGFTFGEQEVITKENAAIAKEASVYVFREFGFCISFILMNYSKIQNLNKKKLKPLTYTGRKIIIVILPL